MATPRKRVSTVYKRDIKQHTGIDSVPASSQKDFMKYYNSIIPQSDDQQADTTACSTTQESAEIITTSDLPDLEGSLQLPLDTSCHFQANDQENLNSEIHGYSESVHPEDDVASTCSSEDFRSSFPNQENSSDSEDLNDEEDEASSSCDMNSFIYKGAQITLAVSLLLILTFATRHSLTSEGISELLQLVHLHCSAFNCLPKTLYAFKHFFSNMQHPLVVHKYCSYCLLGIESSMPGVCQNKLCGKSLKREGSVSGFIEIPLQDQIQSLFRRAGFTESLLHKTKRVKKDKTAVEDIYDGEIYKKLISDGIFNSNYDLTLTFNTDGAKPFRSSKTSLWPIYFMINELPFNERRLPENMLLAGIWYGSKKPHMSGYLNPCMKSLKQLENGMDVYSNEGKVNIRVILIASTCDLPARACVCSMNQYNGESSCVKCLQTGKVVKVGKGHTRVFIPDMDNLTGPSRNDDSVRKNATDAVHLKKPVHGIKGPSWFSTLKYYSFTHGTGIDYMHGVLLGVTKLMKSLWFSSKYSKDVFSISGSVDTVNKRLLQIKPPNYISRLPRSLSDSEYWKASEWKNWLLYYAPAVLYGILSPGYYTHFLLFVESVYLLLKDSVLQKDIRHSRVLLARFVAMFPVMYTDTVMTLNLHQLLHLPDDVLHIGPLWCFSCFPFEDANGFLLQLFNGTQHIDKQIAHAMAVMQKVPELMPAIEKDSVAYELFCRIKNKVSKNKCSFLEDNIYLVGASQFEKELPAKFIDAVQAKLTGPIKKTISFKRVRIEGDTFFSLAYSRVYLRNSYTVAYEEDNEISYGFVEIFLQVVRLCTCTATEACWCTARNFAMIRKLPVIDNCMDLSYVKCVCPDVDSAIIAVDLHAIKRKCVFIHLQDAEFGWIFNVPNILEKD